MGNGQDTTGLVEQLYVSEYNRLVGCLYRRGQPYKLTWEDAQDCASQAFAELYSRLADGKPIDDLRAYIYTSW